MQAIVFLPKPYGLANIHKYSEKNQIFLLLYSTFSYSQGSRTLSNTFNKKKNKKPLSGRGISNFTEDRTLLEWKAWLSVVFPSA